MALRRRNPGLRRRNPGLQSGEYVMSGLARNSFRCPRAGMHFLGTVKRVITRGSWLGGSHPVGYPLRDGPGARHDGTRKRVPAGLNHRGFLVRARRRAISCLLMWAAVVGPDPRRQP